MATIATEKQKQHNWLVWDLCPELNYSRDVGLLAETAGSNLLSGTVLGKVTTSGKWKISKVGATDGSQNPAGLLLNDVTGSVVDQKIAVLTRTAIVGKKGLTLDATYTEKEVAYKALTAIGIKTIDQTGV